MSVRIERVLAPNPGPYTGPGTNTYVIGDGERAVVIDPGPIIDEHAEAIAGVVGERRVQSVIVTHTHLDHAPLANPLARAFDTHALGYAPGDDFEPDERLNEGSTIEVSDTVMTVIHTPGHSDDHLCFLLDRTLFTGDHIMGGSSVMVDDLGPYMRSLERLRHVELDRLLPGHGDEIDRPDEVISWYIAHRQERERQIIAAVEGGAQSVEDVLAIVYADVDESLHPLASRSVSAHLRKLAEEDVVHFEAGTVAIR